MWPRVRRSQSSQLNNFIQSSSRIARICDEILLISFHFIYWHIFVKKNKTFIMLFNQFICLGSSSSSLCIQRERIWTHFRVYFNPLILSRDLHVFFASLSKHHSHRIVVCRSHVACEPEKWNWKDICMSEWVANKSENICVTMCIIGEYAQWMVRFHKYHKTFQSFFPKKKG